jgi:hypothetical protein
MNIKNLEFFTETKTEEVANIYGGVAVDAVNTISRGRAIVTVNLRPVLLGGSDFNGKYESCTGEFDDLKGDLTIYCTGLPGSEQPDKVIKLT